MPATVVQALAPVVALIAFGWLLGRSGRVPVGLAKFLSELSFWVLTPAVLFRSMSQVRIEQLDLRPALAYVLALLLAFGVVLAWRGLDRVAVVIAVGVTYSNAVMIGLPLIQLAWGERGLVTLLTLVPIHSLLLLTVATVVLEFARARDGTAQAPVPALRLLRTGSLALRKAVINPVPLPILAGLAFAQTGWLLPAPLEGLLHACAMVFGPLALLLVGIALAGTAIGRLARDALVLACAKTLAMPVVAATIGWLLGLRGLPLSVLVLTAALPTGANVFIFSQRYGVAQELTTALVAVSTLLALVSVSVVLALFGAA